MTERFNVNEWQHERFDGTGEHAFDPPESNPRMTGFAIKQEGASTSYTSKLLMGTDAGTMTTEDGREVGIALAMGGFSFMLSVGSSKDEDYLSCIVDFSDLVKAAGGELLDLQDELRVARDEFHEGGE